jgi:hypothetical protein
MYNLVATSRDRYYSDDLRLGSFLRTSRSTLSACADGIR